MELCIARILSNLLAVLFDIFLLPPEDVDVHVHNESIDARENLTQGVLFEPWLDLLGDTFHF